MPGSRDALAQAAPDGPDEMGREMAGGPAAVAATLASVERERASLRAALSRARRIVLLGTGASLAAIRAAAPAWHRSGFEAVLTRQAAEAALAGLDGERSKASDLVVAVSQSGATPETVAAASAAHSVGASLIAVTGDATSQLARSASIVVGVEGGAESGASTRSALATLAALLAIPGAIPSGEADAAALSLRLQGVVDSWPEASAAGRLLARSGRTWCLGFGEGLGIAEAGALLWHEKVLRPAVAATPSEFRHGLIEAADGRDAVILLDVGGSAGRGEAYLGRLHAELADLGVAVVPVGAGTSPAGLLAALLRMQQLARATALAAGTYRDGFAVLRHVVSPARELVDQPAATARERGASGGP